MNIADRKFFYDGNQTEIISHAVALIISEAYRAIADHGRFSFVLAGGNSPRLLYEKLAQGVTTRLLEHYLLSCARQQLPQRSDHPPSSARYMAFPGG